MITNDLLETIKDYQNERTIFNKIKLDYITKIQNLEKEIDENFKNINKIYEIYFYRAKIAKLDKFMDYYSLCIEASRYMLNFYKIYQENPNYRLSKMQILIINNAFNTNIFSATMVKYVNKINSVHEDIMGFNVQHDYNGDYKTKHIKIESDMLDNQNVNGLKLLDENKTTFVGDETVREVMLFEGQNKKKIKRR